MNEKKDFVIWIRAISKGQINIEKMKDFDIVGSNEETKETVTIKVTNKDVLSLRHVSKQFELWFEVREAIPVGFYPNKFDFKLDLPVEDETGNPVPYELSILRVKAINEKYFNLLKK